MKLYAVRFLDSHEPIGFFYARTLDELVIMVDEYDCDPAICEYHQVDTSGAIRWEDVPGWKMGERDGRPGDDDDWESWVEERAEKITDSLKTLQFSGGLHLGLAKYLFGHDIKGWKQFPNYSEAAHRYVKGQAR
jgi:hypothetical protein